MNMWLLFFFLSFFLSYVRRCRKASNVFRQQQPVPTSVPTSFTTLTCHGCSCRRCPLFFLFFNSFFTIPPPATPSLTLPATSLEKEVVAGLRSSYGSATMEASWRRMMTPPPLPRPQLFLRPRAHPIWSTILAWTTTPPNTSTDSTCNRCVCE